MKSRAPLTLMEQMVMLLVFALAASLCLQAFVRSDEISYRSYKKGKAALAAQNTVEILRYSGGSPEHAFAEAAKELGGECTDGKLYIVYSEEQETAEDGGSYLLAVREIPTEEKDYRKVQLQVFDVSDPQGAAGDELYAMMTEQDILFELETAWLEVGVDE